MEKDAYPAPQFVSGLWDNKGMKLWMSLILAVLIPAIGFPAANAVDYVTITGNVIDINYPHDSGRAGWLEIHGSEFGLCRIFENEWWHFEPVIAPGWKCPDLIPDPTYLYE